MRNWQPSVMLWACTTAAAAAYPFADAFRSATGDVRERIVCKRNGETQIYRSTAGDNRRTARGVLSGSWLRRR